MVLRTTPTDINAPIEQLKGVSTTILKPLKNLGINTVLGFQIIQARKGRLLENKQGPSLQQQIAVLRPVRRVIRAAAQRDDVRQIPSRQGKVRFCALPACQWKVWVWVWRYAL